METRKAGRKTVDAFAFGDPDGRNRENVQGRKVKGGQAARFKGRK